MCLFVKFLAIDIFSRNASATVDHTVVRINRVDILFPYNHQQPKQHAKTQGECGEAINDGKKPTKKLKMQTATSETRASPVGLNKSCAHENPQHEKPARNEDDQSSKEAKICHHIWKTERRLSNQGRNYNMSPEGS